MNLFKFFSRARSKTTGTPASKEWIAICFRLRRGEFGSDDERDVIRNFAHELEAEVQRVRAGTYDGDEYGGGEACLYLYGPNADTLYSAVEPFLLRCEALKGGYVIKRYGSAAASEHIDFS
jgi:hypothetical protein